MAPITDTFSLVDNACLQASASPLPPDLRSRLAASGLTEVTTCAVLHCPLAYGVRLQHRGRSVVYSGDTRPCNTLVRLGKDCDLLIHEATHEDALQAEAELRAHSTSSEAIEVGRQMGARHVILTHFSQRYANLPLLPDNRPGNVGVAYDNMVVNYGHLSRLPLLYPSLSQMYDKDFQASVERLNKRQRREQRQQQMLDLMS